MPSHAIGELMVEMGYVKAGTGKCSPDCVADEGIIWKARMTITKHTRFTKSVVPWRCRLGVASAQSSWLPNVSAREAVIAGAV